MLKAFPSARMTAWPVDKKFGSVRNDAPDLIERGGAIVAHLKIGTSGWLCGPTCPPVT